MGARAPGAQRPAGSRSSRSWSGGRRAIVARSEFLKALLAQHDDAVLFCVGDDWQAIAGFAGSELAIMRNFEREFGRSAVNHLTQTFRSNQDISDAAKTFVERNRAQLILDDSVLDLVMPEREPFPNAEERRLLYVALTRARHRVYVLTRRGHESVFVTEPEKTRRSGGATVHACPHCKNGTRVRRNGKYGRVLVVLSIPRLRGQAAQSYRVRVQPVSLLSMQGEETVERFAGQ